MTTEREIMIFILQTAERNKDTCVRNGTALLDASDAFSNPIRIQANRNDILRLATNLTVSKRIIRSSKGMRCERYVAGKRVSCRGSATPNKNTDPKRRVAWRAG
jgi:hypothetical protein